MTDTTSAAPSERKSFETHAKERGYRLDRSTGGGYLYGQAAIAWRAWQAARTQETPPAVVEPLTREQLQLLHHIEEFGLFCDYDEFEQIARTIEFAHGIGVKKGGSNA